MATAAPLTDDAVVEVAVTTAVPSPPRPAVPVSVEPPDLPSPSAMTFSAEAPLSETSRTDDPVPPAPAAPPPLVFPPSPPYASCLRYNGPPVEPLTTFVRLMDAPAPPAAPSSPFPPLPEAAPADTET
jgi:hypothetical protein